MDSIVTSLVAGMTRTRIIDWVRTWSALNFESSSDPNSSTVNGPPGATGIGDGEGEKRMSVGEGDGMLTTCPVAWIAVAAAGMKYAKPPATADSAIARAARVMVRKGLRRPRERRARCPGLIPSGTGEDCSPGAGTGLSASC